MEITSGLWLQLVSPGLTQLIIISNRLLVQFLCHYFYYFVLFWLIFWISSWENWFVTIHSLANVYSKADSFSWRWSFVSKFIFALWLDILNYLEHLCFSLVFPYFKRNSVFLLYWDLKRAINGMGWPFRVLFWLLQRTGIFSAASVLYLPVKNNPQNMLFLISI